MIKFSVFWNDLTEVRKKELVELLGEDAYLYFPFTMIITDEKRSKDGRG